jgi:hypothetical protein
VAAGKPCFKKFPKRSVLEVSVYESMPQARI